MNLRGGEAIWDVLARAGVSSTVLRCPCTYPPESMRGRMLAGMGVPDLRGGVGTATFYSEGPIARAAESEQAAPLVGVEGRYTLHIIGPRDTRSAARANSAPDLLGPASLDIDAAGGTGVLRSDGVPNALPLERGKWSDWLHVRFRTSVLGSAAGMMRFLLLRTDAPVQLYASPVNFDPAAPLFPISAPWEYAHELSKRIGSYYTTGMVEDHAGLVNGRFGELEFLAQCQDVMREREAMMRYELERFDEGFFFCLFDTPDRVQHMFWRFREPGHPANARHGAPTAFHRVIEEHYRRCDAVVGAALEAVDDQTLLIVLSDHGFTSFRRGVHLNAWLQHHGFLTLRAGIKPGEEAGDFLRNVDWSATRAYALGLGSIYLNVRGREASGIVAPGDAQQLGADIASRLTGLRDDARSSVAVRGVDLGAQAYHGRYASNAPDLVVKFAPGYRVSWATALGGVPGEVFEDNDRKWGGDHIVDPDCVPGVLFMNRAFDQTAARMVDLAPTVLSSLGVAAGPEMEGRDLLSADG